MMKKQMTKKMIRLLAELLKNSKKSDRELAKVLGMSQPTVSRLRSNLVKEGFVQEFTVIPDFKKMGFEILAISFAKLKLTDEIIEKGKEWMNRYPNIIFAARAEGFGKTGVMISLHKNYTDYSRFVAENRQHWGGIMEDYDTMLITFSEPAVKPLSLKYIAELLEKSESSL